MSPTSFQSSLPVIFESDCVVLGGSFAGVAAAVQLARRGLQVILVEARTYLGREATATLRPWVSLAGKPLVNWLAEFFVDLDPGYLDRQELPLQLDQLKIYLEDLLLLNGVNLLYASIPTQVLIENEQVHGVVIGNKSGRQVIRGNCLIDATETALLARLADAQFESGPKTALYKASLELTGAADFPETRIQVPSPIGVWGDEVSLHESYAGREPMYVEFSLDLPAEADFVTAMQRDLLARQTCLRLAAHLLASDSRFYWGNWTGSSYDLLGFHTPRLHPQLPSWAAGYQSVISAEQKLPLNAFSGPVKGMWVLSEAARLAESHTWFQDPVWAAWLGDRLGSTLLVETGLRGASPTEHLGAKTQPMIGQVLETQVPFQQAPGQLEGKLFIGERESPVRGKSFKRQDITGEVVPILRECQVLVVGGGTSGSIAALASGGQGADTVLVEMNPGLGGTGTLGGVATYWMSNRVGFVPMINKTIGEIHKQLNFQAKPPWIMWNQQAKMAALLKEVREAGTTVYWNAACTGVILEIDTSGKNVHGAVFATRYGPLAILAEVVIDATGDGDLAVSAGAEWVVGDAYDSSTMWSAFPFIHRAGDGNSGNFTAAVDVGNIFDLTRGILEGRRRNQNALKTLFSTWPGKEQHEKNLQPEARPVPLRDVIHDHGIYLPPRESRHVQGDVVMTLSDQLRQRKWPDVVTICFSNYDVKGQTTTDWNRIGLLPPNLMIEVPYRALLPKGIEGMILAGKAISARSDASPSVRMQPDMENLGGACGLAAAIAAQTGCTPRQIDIQLLQARLIEKGVLPARILDRKLQTHDYTQQELFELAAQISFDPPPWEYNNMPLDEVFEGKIPLVELATAGQKAIPVLEVEFHKAEGDRKVFLAQALALLGSQTGVGVLVDRLQEMFANECLPARQAFIFNANKVPPDQGAMPEAVYLLYSLGMARDARSLPVWEEVLDLIDLDKAAFWDSRIGSYHYIHGVCYGIERLADPRSIPALLALHDHPVWRGLNRQAGFEPNFMVERLAALEIAVGRALARCGSRQGFEILAKYLDDIHGLLAEAAHLALVSITGMKLGKDSHTWRDWLEMQEVLEPKPCREPPNIESDLGEYFYIQEDL